MSTTSAGTSAYAETKYIMTATWYFTCIIKRFDAFF